MINQNKELLQDPQAVEAFLSGEAMIVHDLGQLYLQVMGKDHIPKEDLNDFLLGSPEYLEPVGHGWGMSTDDALRCLFDTERTKAFIQGINKSATFLHDRFPGKPLRAIEAGCGTGILAVAMAYAGFDSVIAIDINPVTAHFTDAFIINLGLSDRIKVLNGDATVFAPDEGIHLVVSENMHTGLYFEPQQQIISNLLRFLTDGGIVLPQGISMRNALATIDWAAAGKNHAELRRVHEHIQHGPKLWNEWYEIPFQGNKPFDGVIVGTVPVDNDQANALLTEMNVHVWDGIILPSSMAQFLGQPHAVGINLHRQPNVIQSHGVFAYQAGGEPPKVVRI